MLTDENLNTYTKSDSMCPADKFARNLNPRLRDLKLMDINSNRFPKMHIRTLEAFMVKRKNKEELRRL